jgi:hypothetical protein
MQLSSLDRLTTAFLSHTPAADDSAAVLPPCTTRLALFCGSVDPGWLSLNTQLRRLEVAQCFPANSEAADVLGPALACLTSLTSLRLSGVSRLEGLPESLQKLSALKALRLDAVKPALACLPSGDWLARLTTLACELPLLLDSLPALQAATGLQTLLMMQIKDAPAVAEADEPRWQALCRWAHRHPTLFRVDLMVEPDAAMLPIFVHSGLLDVQRRRPRLTVRSGLATRYRHLELAAN